MSFRLRLALLVGQVERTAYGDGLLRRAAENASLDREPRDGRERHGEDGQDDPDGPAHAAVLFV